jgi:flagellar FliL protein
MSDSAETQTEAPAPSGIKRRLPLLAAVAAGLAVGVGTGAVVIGPVAAKALGFGIDAPADSTHAGEHGDEASDEADSLARAGAAPVVLTLDNLVLNPAASGGSRFLLLTVAMECGDAAALSTLQTRDAELRDVVLSTLSRKTVDELADVMQRDSIKTELLTALNDRFGKKSVVRVYFPQYVVQ